MTPHSPSHQHSQHKLSEHEKIPERCPYCSAKRLVRRGVRKNKLHTVQLWKCTKCERVSSGEIGRGTQYPLRVILAALAWYHQGYSMDECLSRITRRFGYAPGESTVWKWLDKYRDLCTYRRLRPETERAFRPTQLIRKVKLFHRQVYEFSIHRGKLALLLNKNAEHRRFTPIGEYLEDMLVHCPHDLFIGDATARASSAKGAARFDLSDVQIVEKKNHATDMAKLVLASVNNNHLRHESLQHFLLCCDSVTIATEVPIVLERADFEALTKSGFVIPPDLMRATTGHIDFLQIRNGAIHILDYKPDARTNRPIEQLTLYALALSRATGIRLFDFKCAWFNEDTYCEFFPLHVVRKIGKRPLAS
jgi:transposase-like protein